MWRDVADLENEVERYISDVLEGRRPTGRLERLAVERHLRDRARAKLPGATIRENRARGRRALWWIDRNARFSKGEWCGRPFRLESWQAFVVWSLFAWERWTGDRWVRRYRTGYLSMARKNGKTELGAVIALLMLLTGGAAAEGNRWLPEYGAEVYSAATTRDQAMILWKAGQGIANRSPAIKRAVAAYASRHTITAIESGSYFRALAADADTLDGLGPYCAIVDELHAHPDGRVWDVLGSGMGARREPLLMAITTAGKSQDGICGEVEEQGVKVLEGIYEDDSTFAYICRPDPEDDPFSEAAWIKANPNYGVSVIVDGLKLDAKAAVENAARRNEFLRKRVNCWTSGDTAWLPLDRWDACAGSYDLEELRGAPVYLAVDLSATRDTTALVHVFPRPDGSSVVYPLVFVPADTVHDSEIRGPRERELLERFIEDGLVIATAGDMVDQEAIWKAILEANERFHIREIAFDRWQAAGLVARCQTILSEDQVIGFGQGYASMSPAIKETELAILGKRIVHGGNPVLRWQFSNVSLKRDPADNVKFDKGSNSRARIDAMVAFVMAFKRSVGNDSSEGVSVWAIG